MALNYGNRYHRWSGKDCGWVSSGWVLANRENHRRGINSGAMYGNIMRRYKTELR